MIRIHSCFSGNLIYMTTVYIFQKTLDSKTYAKMCVSYHLISCHEVQHFPSAQRHLYHWWRLHWPVGFLPKGLQSAFRTSSQHMMSFLPLGLDDFANFASFWSVFWYEEKNLLQTQKIIMEEICHPQFNFFLVARRSNPQLIPGYPKWSR